MDGITQGTQTLSLHKSRAKVIVEEEQQVRRSPRIAKRARALVDQDAEFDLACSQEWGEVSKEQSDSKKRKVSIAKKSIMV
jgi:hypothetical protein